MPRSWITMIATLSVAMLAQAKPTHVAVLAPDSPLGEKLAPLIEVALQGRAQTIVLDRAAVASVSTEANLQRVLADDATAARAELGRRLGADLLVVLRAGGSERNLEVIIVESRRGIRLARSHIELHRESERTVDQIMTVVDRAVERSNRPGAKLIAISPLVSETATRKFDYLQGALTEALDLALRGSPDVVVLEIEEARSLGDELIASDRVADRELPLILSGSFKHDGFDAAAKMRLELKLSQGGKVAAEWRSEKLASADVVAELTAGAMSLVPRDVQANTPGGAPAHVLDAGTLAAEGQRQFKMERWRQSYELFEAALVMTPGDHALQRDAAHALGKWLSEQLEEIAKRVEWKLARKQLQDSHSDSIERGVALVESWLTNTKMQYSGNNLAAFSVCRIATYERQKQLLYAVMDAKMKSRSTEELWISDYVLQYARESQTPRERVELVVGMARRWKAAGGGLAMLPFALESAGVDADKRTLESVLAEIEKSGTEDARKEVAIMRSRLARGVPVTIDPDAKKHESPAGPLTEGPVVARVERLPPPFRIKDGPLAAMMLRPGTDVFWNRSLYLAEKDKPLRELGQDVVRQPPAFDGRYLWFISRENKRTTIVAFDIEHGRLLRIGEAEGLPADEAFAGRMVCVEHGRVIAAVAAAGTWVAQIKIVAGKPEVKMILTARVADETNRGRTADLNSAFTPWEAAIVDGPASSEGKPSRVALFSHVADNALSVDVNTLVPSVVKLPKDISRHKAFWSASGGKLVWSQPKQGTYERRVRAFDLSTGTETVIYENAPSRLIETPRGVYGFARKTLFYAPAFGEPLKPVKTDIGKADPPVNDLDLWYTSNFGLLGSRFSWYTIQHTPAEGKSQ